MNAVLAPALRPGTRLVLANAVLFQVGWFACVLGAARGMAWIGLVATAAIAAWHLSTRAEPRREALLLAAAMGIGAVWDSGMAASGAIVYADPGPWSATLAPAWILALWVLFAVTLNVSLRWLQGRWWLAALMGAISAPLSYLGGSRLGACVLAKPTLALVALAIGWAVLTPLLAWLAARLDRGPRWKAS